MMKIPSAVCEQYAGEILLVGINYDKRTKEHQCMIEKNDRCQIE